MAHESGHDAGSRGGRGQAPLTAPAAAAASAPPPQGELIAAVATPPGRGGLGIVRLSGANIDVVLAGILSRRPVPRRATLATFLGAGGEVLDTGLAILMPAPASYTGEDTLELQGHGGQAVLGLVLSRCLELGARIAQPGEFTRRAFLNGRLDLAQAEAVADAIEASTARAARAAARSLTGAFSRAVNAVVQGLIDVRVRVESELDFPEESLPLTAIAALGVALADLHRELDAIRGRARRGSLLKDGLSVVLVGAPNVGKSSLLNRLVGDDVAIVTPVAGTTRDTIRERLEIGGIPLHVIDTAGLRESADPVERIGIERTLAAIERADLAVVVSDAAAPDPAGDAHVLASLPAEIPRVFVHNKIDRTGDSAGALRGPRGTEVWLSALTGDGVEALRTALLQTGGAEDPGEDAFLARERHLEALATAERHLVAAQRHLTTFPPPLELIAEDLRFAQDALASIGGAFSPDDLLGEIFSRFCIGK